MLLADFINVGYGDAILLRERETPFTMLVDCGDVHIGRSRPDGQRITAADYLRREGIRELDVLVLTHLHLDHAGGLAHLLPEVRVREFWTNYLPPEETWGRTLPVPPEGPGAPAGSGGRDPADPRALRLSADRDADRRNFSGGRDTPPAAGRHLGGCPFRRCRRRGSGVTGRLYQQHQHPPAAVLRRTGD